MRVTTNIVRRIAVVGLGACAVGAIAIPSAQAADGAPAAPKPPCSVIQIAAAHADSAPKVLAYLQANPAVVQELTTLRGEPRDQRRADLKTYLQANPGVKTALQTARAAERDLRTQCSIRR